MHKSRVIAPFLASTLAATYLALVTARPADAIYQGKSALGASTVVKLFSAGSGCSAGLVSRRIVVTAAHCVVRNGNVVALSEVRVYLPGVDVGQRAEFARALAIFYPPGFFNATDSPEVNDIAFITVDKDLPGSIVNAVADNALVKKISEQGLPVEIYGYGVLASGGASSLLPYFFTTTIMRQLRYVTYLGFERTYFNLTMDERGAACPGDSGGPVIARYNDRTYLVGVISGGSGPCSKTPENQGSATATIAGEYLNLFNDAIASLNRPKPNVLNSLLISSNTYRAELSWRESDDPDRLVSSYLVTDQSGRTICKAVELSCKVFLKVGINKFAVQSVSGKELSDPHYISTELQLPPPHSINLVGTGLTRQLQWQPPDGYQEIITGFAITNLAGVELCTIVNLQCSVAIRPGENSFQLRAITADGEGDKVTSTFLIRNAATPVLTQVAVLTSGAKVSWAIPTDFADSSEDSMRVDIRDGISGPILCSAPVNEQECIFELKKKQYQLTIGFTSDLGEGEKVVSQILDGVAANSIRIETLALSKKITSMLATLGKTNPGYHTELNNLSKQIVQIDPSFEFTSRNLAKLQLTWQKTLTLQKKIKSYPRPVSILCYKGSLVTKISAVNPRCPTGYRQR